MNRFFPDRACLNALLMLITLLAPCLAFAVTPGRTLVASFAPDAIVAGDQTTLSWAATGASVGYCAIYGVSDTPLIGLALSGSTVITPTASLSALVECEGPVGTTQGDWLLDANASVTVASAPQQPTVSVSFTPATITRGSGSTLAWTSQWATDCSSQDVAGVSGSSGSVVITPQVTQPIAVTVTCTGPAGQGSGSATLTVLPRGRPQVVIFPGTGGTRLEAVDGSGPVWVDADVLNVLSPRDWNTFFQTMALTSDPSSSDPQAVQPLFGQGVRAVSDGYLGDGLRGTGCITNWTLGICLTTYLGGGFGGTHLAEALWAAGIDLVVVNYDWRMAWENHYDAIKQAFDTAYARGQGERVYVIGHSQGTQLARRFLQDNPEYQSMVALNFAAGAPNLGSPAATMANSSYTGGMDFGMGSYPIYFNKTNGLLLGGHTPSSYYSGPSEEFLRILHYNTGRWPYEQIILGKRVQPEADTPEAAQRAMRSGSIAPGLFDAGVRVQNEMAGYNNNIPTFQIISDDRTQPSSWRIRATNYQYIVDIGMIPSDGTIPTISSLGQYCGCVNLGSLVIPVTDPNSDHQHLIDSSYAQSFITRAILRDRGASDPNFDFDFALQSDQEILQHIGWTLPPAGGAATVSSKVMSRNTALLPQATQPANRLEFTTRDVDAQLTIQITDLAAGGTPLLYVADKSGVKLLNPDYSGSQQIDSLNLDLGDTPTPALMATSRTLFHSNFEADDGGTPIPSAQSEDLDSITIRLPLSAGQCEVTISADRVVSGMARVIRQDVTAPWAKVANDAALAAGDSLLYTLDAVSDPVGTMYRDSAGSLAPLPLVDDPDFTSP